MKKLFFVLLLFLCITCVKAEETTKLDIKWIPNVYFNYKKDNLTYWGQSGYLYVDGKIAYCLELEKSINTDTYTYTDELMNNNLVILAGYFGYGYNNEINLKDYLATQKLIWHFLGTDVYFTTKSMGEGDKIDVRDYELKIGSRINRYALFPKIDRNLVFDYGSSNVIYDSNEVISKMDLINDSGNNIYIDSNNNLVFNANEVGKNKFYLSTKYISNYKNQILTANNSQKIMVIGEVDNIKGAYNYEVNGGSIKISVMTTSANGADLRGNKFELYDSNNNLVGNYMTNNEGSIYIEKLKYDHYILKYTYIIPGYKTDKEVYDIYLSNDNRNIIQDIYINPLLLRVNINKTYGNKKLNFIKGDSNIIYNIYDKDGNFTESIVTDENGNCNSSLYYDDYTIKQINSSNGIIHDDISISKSDFISDSKNIEIYDEINNFILRIKSNDIDTEETIDNFKFKMNSDEFIVDSGIININLEYGNYCFSDVFSEGYENADGFCLDIDENSDFNIENDELVLDLIIYFKKEPIIEEIIIEEPIIPTEEIIEEIVPIEEPIVEEKVIDSTEDNKKLEDKKEEITKVVEENIEKDIIEKEETIENKIDVKIENKEIHDIEKLPNLGVYYEEYKIFNLVYMFGIFNLYKLFKYRTC